MIDLHPAALTLGDLVATTPQEALDAPTPCTGMSVSALLDHVDGFAEGLASTARKAGGPAPVASAQHLRPGWRERIPAALHELADAWADPQAWQGDTEAGGIPLPGHVAGLVTADELVVHAWDLARATGREVDLDPAAVEASLEFVVPFVAETGGTGSDGLFDAALPVPDDADDVSRLLLLTGRDPALRAPRAP